MRKILMMIGVLLLTSFLLVACGDGDETNDNGGSGETAASGDESGENNAGFDLPEEVIQNADSDPIALENQMGLEIGDTGYTITQSENQALAATLNSTSTTQDLGAETKEGEEFYLVGDFTLKNVGNDLLMVEFPDAAYGTEEERILNDELGRGDRLGVGVWYLDENVKIDSDNAQNRITLEPGEEETHKIAIAMKEGADEYIIYFGFFAQGNRYYQNKIAWTVPADQVD